MTVTDPRKEGLTMTDKPFIALYTALAKARGEFPEIPKNRTAFIRSDRGNYSYKYADLADIFRAVNPVLAKHGLGVWQEPRGDGELITTVFHENGECWQAEPWPIKPMNISRVQRENKIPVADILVTATDFQGAVTATKRYALQAALGISTDETVEGSVTPVVSENFTDTRNDNMGIGVKGSAVQHDATPAEKAAAYSEGIIKAFSEVKTPKGLTGVWSRNEAVIDRLQETYSDLYNNVLDAYEARRTALSSEDAE